MKRVVKGARVPGVAIGTRLAALSVLVVSALPRTEAEAAQLPRLVVPHMRSPGWMLARLP